MEESLSGYDSDSEELRFVKQCNYTCYGSTYDSISAVRLITTWYQEGKTFQLEQLCKQELLPTQADHCSISITKESDMFYHLSSRIRTLFSSLNEAENFQVPANNQPSGKPKLGILRSSISGN
jgi:hypothetical protein